MANINLNLNILDGTTCPTIILVDPTTLSVIINEGTPILGTNVISFAIPQSSLVTIEVDKTGYNTYINTLTVGLVDITLNIILNQTVVVDFINIINACHNYTINNNGLDSTKNVTFTITDLNNNVITNYLNVPLNFSTSNLFSTTSDGVYIVIVKDNTQTIIRNYIILDYCDILNCISNRILDILCTCNSTAPSSCDDYCKKNFELERISLLFNDLMNRVNKEYSLNQFYTTLDSIKVNDLTSTQTVINSLISYCSQCGCTSPTDVVDYSTILSINNNTTNSNCGCS